LRYAFRVEPLPRGFAILLTDLVPKQDRRQKAQGSSAPMRKREHALIEEDPHPSEHSLHYDEQQ
jgi:hypothetical protein